MSLNLQITTADSRFNAGYHLGQNVVVLARVYRNQIIPKSLEGIIRISSHEGKVFMSSTGTKLFLDNRFAQNRGNHVYHKGNEIDVSTFRAYLSTDNGTGVFKIRDTEMVALNGRDEEAIFQASLIYDDTHMYYVGVISALAAYEEHEQFSTDLNMVRALSIQNQDEMKTAREELL